MPTRLPKRHLATRWLGALASLLVFATSSVKAQGQGGHLVAFSDLRDTKQVDANSLSLSPDGRWLAYSLDGTVWLVSTQQGSLPQKIAHGLLPVWSPDGTRIAYYSEQSKSRQLWTYDRKSGSRERITAIVGGIAPDPSASMDGWLYDEYRYSWSPDGRYLVFASMATVNNTDGGEVDVPLPIPRKGKQTGEPLILTNTTPREWTLQGVFAESSKTVTTERMAADVADKQTDSPARRNQLFVVDSRIHSVRQVTTDDSIYIDPQWSPDGKTIVCASSESRPLYGYGPDTMNIYAIDVATGTKVALTTGPGRKWMPSWSPDGGQVAYWGGKNG